MRKLAFIIGIICLVILFFNYLSSPISISSLNGINSGTHVFYKGEVIETRVISGGKLLIFDTFSAICQCNQDYTGRLVSIEGIVEEYNSIVRVRVYSIKKID